MKLIILFIKYLVKVNNKKVKVFAGSSININKKARGD
jgi:hypothetical protein